MCVGIIARQADIECGDREVRTEETTYEKRNPFVSCSCSKPLKKDSKKDSKKDTKKAPETKETVTNATKFMHCAEIDELLRFWKETQLEIVILVEGIDAVTAATIQVRHSYRVDDLLLDHRFVNSVSIDPATGAAVIDFQKFNQTEPVDYKCLQVDGSLH